MTDGQAKAFIALVHGVWDLDHGPEDCHCDLCHACGEVCRILRRQGYDPNHTYEPESMNVEYTPEPSYGTDY